VAGDSSSSRRDNEQSDFHVTHTKEQWVTGTVDYNFPDDGLPAAGRPSDSSARRLRVERRGGLAQFRREGPGVSAFTLEDGVVYYTYSAYERGLGVLWGMDQWLDRAPFGRNDSQ
jgi:predicted dithiol-disulfide oxidoreductase (DUF899 family)